MSTSVACPACGTSLQTPPVRTANTMLRCPRCLNLFNPPEPEPAAAAPAPAGRQRREFAYLDESPPPDEGSGKNLAFMLLGGGIVVMLILLIGGVVLGVMSMTGSETAPKPRAGSSVPPAAPATAPAGRSWAWESARPPVARRRSRPTPADPAR